MKLLFMNKILQIRKLFFTETNSRHAVQIFKSFIYRVICHKTNITYFRIHAQTHAQIMTFIMSSSAISAK